MSYRDTINNALGGKCIPYRKATLSKLNELLEQGTILDKIRYEIAHLRDWLLAARKY